MMTSVLNIALTGMRHNLRSVETSARNIANLNTDGYRAQRYDPASGTTRPRNDEPVSTGDSESPSDVDLATELVEIKRHEIGYRANAIMIVAADRMMGDLLDVLG